MVNLQVVDQTLIKAITLIRRIPKVFTESATSWFNVAGWRDDFY